MKVAVHLTLDVDEKAWIDTYGTRPDEVRSDVRIYVADLVLYSAATGEALIKQPIKVKNE